MKKLFLKSTGEPVEIGDVIKLKSTTKTPYSVLTTVEKFTVTEDNIEKLLEKNIITAEVGEEKAPIEIEDYISSLACKEGWPYGKMLSYVEKLDEIFTPAAFSLLLKTIAKKLDKKYEGHISESDEIWVISTLNGKPAKVEDKSVIVNYDNFAAFRSEKDAEFALKVMKPFIEDMYPNESKN